MKKVFWPFFMLILLVIDQISKSLVVHHFQLGEVKSILPHIFSLTYLKNSGAAYSILQNQQWLFAVITVCVLAAAIYYFIKKINGSRWLLLSLSLIIAGGLGNFIDRIRQGFVVDMIQLDFIHFAIFNIADICLTVGVVLLFVMIIKEEEDGSNRKK